MINNFIVSLRYSFPNWNPANRSLPASHVENRRRLLQIVMPPCASTLPTANVNEACFLPRPPPFLRGNRHFVYLLVLRTTLASFGRCPFVTRTSADGTPAVHHRPIDKFRQLSLRQLSRPLIANQFFLAGRRVTLISRRSLSISTCELLGRIKIQQFGCVCSMKEVFM